MIIVTGVSTGLGRALAELYLENGKTVVGLGRHNTLEHPNFTFIQVDLSSVSALEELDLSWVHGEVTLINNAGMIGEIGRISELESWDLERVMHVNTIAPMLLAKRCYASAKHDEFTLVNISSGAARRAIPSWAAYCASKSALNMLSENFYMEELELGRSPKVYAVAPGVIDTPMQKEIRSADPVVFSAHQNFVDLKNEEKLFSPAYCAQLLDQLLAKHYPGEVFYDLRDV
jgi:benzil reductase ((S)-benzoin forming)